MNEEPKPIHEELSLGQRDDLFATEKAKIKGHAWRQQGNAIVCTSCPFEHSFIVRPGTFLVGIDESGNPVLKEHFTTN